MSRLDKFIRALILLFCALYLFNAFFPFAHFQVAANLLLAVFLLVTLPNIPRLNRNVCLSFFLIGLVIFLYCGAGLAQMLQALSRNSGLFLLFAFVPLMTMPFFYDTYQEEIGNIAKRYLTNLFPFLLFIQLASYALSLVMAMGCLIILYDLFGKQAREYQVSLPFRMALLQGYAMGGMWGPGSAPAPITTDRLGMQWLEIVPAGLVFSLLALLISAAIIWLILKSNPEKYPRLQPDAAIIVKWEKAAALFLLATALLSSLLLVSYFTGWSMFLVLPIVSLPFAFLTALEQKKLGKFKIGLKNYYAERIIRGKPELCLFIVGGFLGTACEYSQIANYALANLPQELFIYPASAAAFIMLIIISLALLGVHPVVVAPSLAMAINPASIGLQTLPFAMAILSGWSLGINISPFSSQSMIMTGLEQKSPWEIGPYTNWRFTAAMLVVFSGAVAALEKFSG